ncbi:hypothetical protein RSOLAG1IB_10886 [Rhizoctonia solani AG-1 IB]|uniref:BED-type domain-containing protein n=1 Tax=Thanatephorus cucumeris (strain AG1-IB / isolate 7/3/14) TaxID=1108050 RepID=A0A0B7G535_THACB|nr:hypothetical protein RSOLAG1IB_10886 [Rhizoctonia solani AG-1 IB]
MTPQAKPAVPQSFTFYQPSVPITLPKPIDELTREEIRALIAKRPVDYTQPNPDHDAPGPSKRQCKPTDKSDAVVLPPTIAATIPVGHGSATQQRPRRVACECWSFMTACETKEPPVGISRAELVATDIADLESRVFRLCRRPQPATRIRCLLCWFLLGHWKTWVSGDGLTTRIREHLDNHHHHEYREKCQQEGVTVPSLDLSLAGDNTSNLVFSQRLLAEYLAQWAAVDDQAMRVVERHEFRRILLLCSRAPNLRDSDIPHRKKLTTVTSELYNAEMTCIKHELNKALGFVSVTSDLWSDEKLHSFMTVTIHYINSLGDLSEHLLAF